MLTQEDFTREFIQRRKLKRRRRRRRRGRRRKKRKRRKERRNEDSGPIGLWTCSWKFFCDYYCKDEEEEYHTYLLNKNYMVSFF